MSWTKKELIQEAFDAIGIASYSFDLEEDQYVSALRKLDSMMASWNGLGLRLSYPLYDSQSDSDIDEASNVPDWANEAVYLNLATRIAPSFGKMISPDIKQNARNAYDVVMARITRPPEYSITGLPQGQGSKAWRYDDNVTLRDPSPTLTDGSGDEIDL